MNGCRLVGTNVGRRHSVTVEDGWVENAETLAGGMRRNDILVSGARRRRPASGYQDFREKIKVLEALRPEEYCI